MVRRKPAGQSHARRKLYELYVALSSPIAAKATDGRADMDNNAAERSVRDVPWGNAAICSQGQIGAVSARQRCMVLSAHAS